VINETLRGYADRGVFRGFSETRDARGRLEYRFSWLTRRPMAVVFHPATNVLAFRTLLPGARAYAGLVRELNGLVKSRTARDLPAHKRLDRRRATLAASVRQGGWSLATTIRGANHEYATRFALHLINDILLVLHERYPDYLVQQFGFVDE
jgi:hypothetical protein